ncbi:MAG: hypothetical protein ACWA41_12070 [Putridiphycobacter sp.]
MRKLLGFIFIFYSCIGAAQDSTIDSIRVKFKYINAQDNYTIVELNNLDFWDQIPDHGAQLKGYFKQDTLYKIVEWYGLSFGHIINEYYLWNNQPVFVYHLEKTFQQLTDEQGIFLEFNYDSLTTIFESRHYFNQNTEIKTLEKGESFNGDNQVYKSLLYLDDYKTALQNKYKYQAQYKLLQGKWHNQQNPKQKVEIEGLIKTDFVDSKFTGEYRIKIDHTTISFQSLGETDILLKYKLVTLTQKKWVIKSIETSAQITFVRA